ncbi:Bifunctional inhibitor/lipid-transfer protein/seed storage 2Salbumin superfamily protein [Zostera marina]|uniref:Bifunctional inhibitor/lipid-transfer protein/seed storage 2Salbumin superfamily protein n=1 Tax=Zostera marina TaxID=29655 RepID=A0A0K9NX84_ZOSMR|nr:Bifunctional inhibitor/lipid-transfer protein/seed storage 2Salbumin superfamily protein [Zostera marina]
MADKKMIVLVALMVVAAVSVVDGQRICNISRTEFDECLPAMIAPDPTFPSKRCCENIHNADLPCMCSYKDSYLATTVLQVDTELAMKIPKKCGRVLPSPC